MKARWCMTAVLAVAMGAVGCDDGEADPADAGGAGGEGGMPDMAGQGGDGGQGGMPDMAGQGGDGGQGGMPDMAGQGGDGGQGGTPDMGPDPDMTPPTDAAPADAAPVESPIECPEICTALQTMCPEAFAIQGDCTDCDELSAAFAGGETGPLLNAADTCAEATESNDCRALYTCLADPDGLFAVGTGARLTIVGNVGGVDYDLAIDDAWVAVGTTNDGTPSDLELSFVTPDGRFMAVKFDNLPADVGAVEFALLDAGNNEIQVKLPGERFDLDNGRVEVMRFAMGGDDPGFQISAQVRENGDAALVTITAEGTFEPGGPVVPDPEPEPDPEAPIQCPDICTGLQTQCPEAFAIHGNCDDCAELSAAFEAGESPPLLNAAAVCNDAVETDDCQGLYTCLIDPDGLLAVGTGVSLTLVGNVGGIDYDLAVDDAWAAVGTTNDGTPSDLELSFFTAGERFMVVKFDNLPADVGALGFGLLDANNNEVRVQIPGQRVDLDTGLVHVERFEMPGGEDPGFQITAEVRENAEATPVTVTAQGAFP